MTDIWFTADHHFDHANIIKFCDRPFSSVCEMDEALIASWNANVKPEDEVYYLGDFTLGFEPSKYIERLHGQIVFIPGGHDRRWISWWNNNQGNFFPRYTIADWLFELEVDDPENDDYPVTLVLCHYAMRVWEKSHYGSFHLYGHSHGKLPGIGRSMDVGVDTNPEYRPYHIDEIISKLSKIEPHNGVKK